MEPVIRNMTIDDVSAVLKIENQCFTDPWSENMVRDLVDSAWDEVWVLEEERADDDKNHSQNLSNNETGRQRESKLIGYINYRFIAGEGELMRIAVLPSERGHGYARKLMDIMINDAAKNHVPDITLEVRAGNEAAIGLYKSYNFKEEAIRRAYYHNPTEDAFIMWLRGLPAIPT